MSKPPSNEELRELLLLFPDQLILLLHDLYYDNLLRISERQTHNEKASEDVVQEAFLDIWENRKKLTKNKNLYVVAHLVTIVKNRSINFYRRAVWLNGDDGNVKHPSEYNIENLRDPDWDFSIEQKQIWTIIDTFPKREKACLYLRFKQNMSNKEIAKELKITIKGVEARMGSAYERLRKYEPAALRKKFF